MGEEWPLGSRLGVVGGGQLGRMLAEAAAPLGVELIIVDPTPRSPASPLAREQIVAPFDDSDAIRQLAERCDVLTYEIELADPDLLEAVGEETDTPVHPSPETLRTIQDKLVQKRLLCMEGIPVPAFRKVDSVESLRSACEALGYPVMLKTRTGGYDGRGNVLVADPSEVEESFSAIGADALAERYVDFVREISVIGVKGDGERATYIAGENVHEDEILRETVVPARAPTAALERAERVAGQILDLMTGRGVYGIELFETRSGEILVNEVAPRPHNSGHWTIEGAVTSQFEQHVRAVCGGPLGATTLRNPIVVANLLADVNEPSEPRVSGIDAILAASHVSLHWYGKREARPLRKMGHITVFEPGGVHRDRLLEDARAYVDGVTFR